MNIQWSDWFSLSEESVSLVPEEQGIYEIRTDYEIDRLRGKSRIVSIGRAVPNLKSRLSGRIHDPARFMNRCEKWLICNNHRLEFHYHVAANSDDAKWFEAVRHWEYENEHWELPPGNDRLEKTPVTKKLRSMVGEINRSKLRNLLADHRTVEGVASYLGVPPVVVENLRVYFLV
jgi:hypothetical protein